MPDLSRGLCVRAEDKKPWIDAKYQHGAPGYVHPLCEGCPVLKECQDYATLWTWHRSVVVGGWSPRGGRDRRAASGACFYPPWRDDESARPTRVMGKKARARWESEDRRRDKDYLKSKEKTMQNTCDVCSEPAVTALRVGSGWLSTCEAHRIDWATWQVIVRRLGGTKLDAA